MTRLQRIRVVGAGTSALSAMLFIVLAAAVISGATSPLDETIRHAVHAWSSEQATAIAQAFSFVGSAIVWLPLSILAATSFWWVGWRHAAADLAIVMAGAAVLENALKALAGRARPAAFFGTLPESFSFPSGHALFAGSLYVALACLIAARVRSPTIGIAVWAGAGTMVAGIGLSRIYLGVHFPSDVAGGYLAAAGWIGAVTAVRATDRS